MMRRVLRIAAQVAVCIIGGGLFAFMVLFALVYGV